MRMRQHIGGRLLTAQDVATPVLVTINSCAKEEVGENHDQKLVFRFAEISKGLTVNGERMAQLEAIFHTDDSDTMIGRQVVLFQGTTRFQGRDTPCVSIRSPKVGATAAAESGAAQAVPPVPSDLSDDDIPF